MTSKTLREKTIERANKALDRIAAQKKEERPNYATGRGEDNRHLGPHMDVDSVMKGVTIGWLAQAFNFNHHQVKAKLRDCPPLYRKKDGFVYSLPVAVPYLIKPVFNIEEYLKTARIEDLPLRLQTEFWAAMNKKREYEEATGQLWRSEDVFEILGQVFQMMKNTIQLWSSDVEKKTEMSEAQRVFVKAQCDKLQDKIYEALVVGAKNPRTKSVRQMDADAEAAEAAKVPSPVKEDEEEEDDDQLAIAALI